MTEDADKIEILDGIVSALTLHEKKLRKHVEKLEQMTRRIKDNYQDNAPETLLSYLEAAATNQLTSKNSGRQSLAPPIAEPREA